MLGSDTPVTIMMIAITTANSVKLNPAFELTFYLSFGLEPQPSGSEIH
jgi:hypothetical protein